MIPGDRRNCVCAGSAPHRRRQRGPDDRARHQHLPAGRARGRGARSRTRRSRNICEAILAAAGTTVRWIIVTHTHRDHSPLARRARARDRGARDRIAASRRRAAGRELSPRAHCPATASGCRSANIALTAIHTPGHASNCVCYLLGTRAAAVHRRSCARRRLTGHSAARRRYGGSTCTLSRSCMPTTSSALRRDTAASWSAARSS